MSPSPTSPTSYGGALPALARLVLRVFFRRIEVVGASGVPAEGPLIFVANHANGLVDPALVVGFLPRRPRFLAKSTLWRNPILRPFLAAGRVVPVYRRQDVGVDRSRNRESLDESAAVVAAGGAIALFPEGRSHSEPALSPLRTGAARIALAAAEAGRNVVMVPVGLHFDDKEQFRSRALVEVGSPVVVEPVKAVEPTAVRELTARLTTALSEVAPSYDSWDEAWYIELAAEIVQREEDSAPRAIPLRRSMELRRLFLDGVRRARAEQPARLEALAATLERYRHLLDVLALRDHQVASRYTFENVGGFVARSLLHLVLELPVSLFGALLNWLPYRACGAIAAHVARHPEEPASYKMFGGLVLFPLWWTGWTFIAVFLRGGLAAAAVAILLPLSGFVALRSRDRLRLLGSEGRALWRVATDHRIAEVRREREAVRREILALARELSVSPRSTVAPTEPA